MARLERESATLYGIKLKQVLLYGSRARGDHRDDSDDDVRVVIARPFQWGIRLGAISDAILRDCMYQEF